MSSASVFRLAQWPIGLVNVGMGDAGKQFKIVYSIILAVAIDVMNYLGLLQGAPKMLRHHPAVFKHSSAIDSDNYIAGVADRATIIDRLVRIAILLEAFVMANAISKPVSRFAAIRHNACFHTF